jgi:hypothetical protein
LQKIRHWQIMAGWVMSLGTASGSRNLVVRISAINSGCRTGQTDPYLPFTLFWPSAGMCVQRTVASMNMEYRLSDVWNLTVSLWGGSTPDTSHSPSSKRQIRKAGPKDCFSKTSLPAPDSFPTFETLLQTSR